MFELRRVTAEDGPAVLEFEVANRGYFASFISDRGDAFFARFGEQWDSLMASQVAGTCAYHVLVDSAGAVVGRFNLFDIEDGSAVLGYRVASRVAGRGVATAAVRELCGRAVKDYGLGVLRAAAADRNVASQKVLTKAGFVAVGPAAPEEVGGHAGTWFRLDLS
jgi:[ribosomal protein S5]-alanine N-acetyltransferase